MFAMLPKFYIDEIILKALKEDINYIDVSADTVIPADQDGAAVFLAKADGVLCGIDIAMRVFELLDDSFKKEVFKKDGDAVKSGDIIAKISGKTAMLLKGERTALNILQHMSGIATATSRCAELVKGTGAMVTDTRKTLPGLRPLQKYAVTVGGGKNHRYNLSDGAMLKDNHLDAYGGIKPAVAALREKIGHMVKIEVEVRDFDELNEALECGVEVIMLDNMSCEDMKKAVEITAGRALLEASGNITLENIKDVASTGVNIISLGALTHSVKCFDISMRIKSEK
jgi:nicotinate-nucleotide pyrophosphorylase (carboxylating)